MTLSPRAYGDKLIPSAAPTIGGIQDETPMGAGMLDTAQQHSYQPPVNNQGPDGSKKTFTFTRKTIIIIAVVVVVIIGALVGGLVGGLKSKNNNSSPSDASTQSGPGATSTSGNRDSGTTSSRGPGVTPSPTGGTSSISEIDTLRGTATNDNAYPTTATYSIINASGVSGIAPSPFPGFDEQISSDSLLTNGDFKSGNFDGWTNDDNCWSVRKDPSTQAFTPLEKSTNGNDWIARNTADDLSGGKSCNLTQVVTGAKAGILELSFLWGHYERDDETWFYVSAGPPNRQLVVLAMQDVPGFSRTIEWQKGAFSFDFAGGDFVVTFSAHSKAGAQDIAQVQLIQK